VPHGYWQWYGHNTIPGHYFTIAPGLASGHHPVYTVPLALIVVIAYFPVNDEEYEQSGANANGKPKDIEQGERFLSPERAGSRFEEVVGEHMGYWFTGKAAKNRSNVYLFNNQHHSIVYGHSFCSV
jgi:hypothetical protein